MKHRMENTMDYTVTAYRYQRSDGVLMTADKRVHTGLSHEDADKLFKRYVRDENGYRNDYWHDVRMTREDYMD